MASADWCRRTSGEPNLIYIYIYRERERGRERKRERERERERGEEKERERERERVVDISRVHHSIETVRIGYARNKKKSRDRVSVDEREFAFILYLSCIIFISQT